ncbi:DUF1801 domain-containing protein [Fluviicola sp.]|uniref:DUF1801 domain-containing protein n=1 Tax=Fluviicola sp. TaxID=1917219 RepID=UPI003D28B8D8
MRGFDERITHYISKSADFAQPILNQLRETVHLFCPEVEEGMKWSMPFFMYRGKILCNMASFKNHCSFGFWLHSEMSDPHGLFKRAEDGGMGSLGKITSLTDLPKPDHLGACILEAMTLTDQGTIPRELNPKVKKPVAEPPLELIELLEANPKAKATFDSFPLPIKESISIGSGKQNGKRPNSADCSKQLKTCWKESQKTGNTCVNRFSSTVDRF